MWRAATLLAVITFAQGCVRLQHSLSDIAEEVRAEELEGEWLRHDPVWGVSDEPMRIIASAGGGARVAYTDGQGDERETKLIRVAGLTLVEDRVVLPGDANAQGCLAAKIERRGDWMAIWKFDKAVIRRFIENGRLKGKVIDGFWNDDIDITADAKEFEQFLIEHGDEVFDKQHALYSLKSE